MNNEVFDKNVLDILEIDEKWLSGPAHHAPRSVRKLVSLAAACEMAGQLVLWDEPTVSLDAHQKRKVIELMNHYAEKSFLMVTHDIALSGVGRSVKIADI